jgi:folate-dependent phosphoribosylglycinamide formyltransferase PurN
MYRLGWFSTGRGKGSRRLLQAIHESIELGEIEAEIAFVFCNRERGESEATDTFLDMVESYHIPLVTFSYQKFKTSQTTQVSAGKAALPSWRLHYDREMMTRLKSFKPDLCILAGYMLIVEKELCQKYNMINLHPAAPGGPKGTWQEVIGHLIKTRAEQTGIMMHLVTPELDEGPVVTYCTFPLKGRLFDKYWNGTTGQPLEQIEQIDGKTSALFQLIREQEFARETPLIKATIKAFSQGKVSITTDKKGINSNGKYIAGYDLTDEINEVIKDKFAH